MNNTESPLSFIQEANILTDRLEEIRDLNKNLFTEGKISQEGLQRVGDELVDLIVKRQILLIADKFSELLFNGLGFNTMTEVVKRNEVYGEGICATHDFVDANEFMAEAFEEVMGYEMNISNQKHVETWNDSWELASKGKFGIVHRLRKEVQSIREGVMSLSNLDLISDSDVDAIFVILNRSSFNK